MNKIKSTATSQLFKFGAVGLVGYLVDASVTVLFSLLVGPYIARVPGFILAASTTWILNRFITFGVETSRYKNVRHEFFHYFGLMLGGLAVNYSIYTLWVYFTDDFSGKLLIGVALGSLSGMVMNFFLSKKYIYKNS